MRTKIWIKQKLFLKLALRFIKKNFFFRRNAFKSFSRWQSGHGVLTLDCQYRARLHRHGLISVTKIDISHPQESDFLPRSLTYLCQIKCFLIFILSRHKLIVPCLSPKVLFLWTLLINGHVYPLVFLFSFLKWYFLNVKVIIMTAIFHWSSKMSIICN